MHRISNCYRYTRTVFKILSTLIDIISDALKDTLLMVPFLFGVYILIEYMEHASSDKIEKAFKKLGPFGPLGGAVIGTVPQCGVAAAAANLYSGGIISLGTIIAVFIAASDEAIPMLIANPSKISALWKLIVIKIAAAVLVGILVDMIYRFCKRNKTADSENHFHELCENCGCDEHGILYSALKHTVNIALFVFIITLILNAAITFVGQDTIARVMMSDNFFQPFVSALVGFIPNCASSVIITQLYLEDGILSFGSAIAGLCTSAGLGLLVLFKTNKKHMKQNFIICGILYAAAVLTGVLINALY